MARGAALLASIALSLWLGGMIFLFIAVQTLFKSFPRATSDVALEAAPRIFAAFEQYQLIIAAIALLVTFVWYLADRSRLVMVIFVLLALSALGGALSSVLITSKMQQLRVAGQSHSVEFRRLHGRSMMVYTSQAALLVAGAITLPAALRAAPYKAKEAPPE